MTKVLFSEFSDGLGAEESQLRMEKQFYVYIVTNKRNTVFYTGVTNNLLRRIFEHKHKRIEGFTKRYNIGKLVFYEVFPTAYEAIILKRRLKDGYGVKKLI